jgi:hypothetical protein
MKSDILRYRIRACIGSSALSFIRALHVSAAYISRSSHTVFWEPLNDSPCERLYFFCMILSQCSVVKLRGPNEEVAFSPPLVRKFSVRIFSSTAVCQRLCHQRLCDCVSDVVNTAAINDCVNTVSTSSPESMMTIYIYVYIDA